MTVVIDNKENHIKERYKQNNNWIEDLFTMFYIGNRHLPSKITAMREVIYEKTGIKVKKPIFSRTEADNLYNNSKFNWSNYSPFTKNSVKEQYGHENYWIQHLFTRFYIENHYLPHVIKAMREVIYEESNIKVRKPIFTRDKATKLCSTDEFDWSDYNA